jgi:hypothetical protein
MDGRKIMEQRGSFGHLSLYFGELEFRLVYLDFSETHLEVVRRPEDGGLLKSDGCFVFEGGTVTCPPRPTEQKAEIRLLGHIYIPNMGLNIWIKDGVPLWRDTCEGITPATVWWTLVDWEGDLDQATLDLWNHYYGLRLDIRDYRDWNKKEEE